DRVRGALSADRALGKEKRRLEGLTAPLTGPERSWSWLPARFGGRGALRRYGEGGRKDAPAAHSGLHLHLAAEHLPADLTHHRQAGPGAGPEAPHREARLKDLFEMLGGDSDALILNGQAHDVVASVEADYHRRLVPS